MDQGDVQDVIEERDSAEHGHPPRDRSRGPARAAGISAIVGPSVISRKLSEAGYLVVLRNESSAGMSVPELQGRGSPYRLSPLRSRKSAIPPRPDRVTDPVPPCRLEHQDRAEGVSRRHHADPRNDRVQDHQRPDRRFGERGVQDAARAPPAASGEPRHHGVVQRDDGEPEPPTARQRKAHEARHEHHAPADHPDDAGQQVVGKSKLNVHATRITVSSSSTSHRPRTSRKRERSAMPAAVEEGARAGEEDEGGRAEVGDPAGEEDAREWAHPPAGRSTRGRGRSPSGS